MIITVAALAIGLVIGLARGGRVRNLARRHLQWPAVGAVGVVGLLATRWGGMETPELLLATSLLLCASCALRNAHLVGLGVVAVGLVANLAPLLVNGWVPVDPDALVHAGLVDRDDLARVELDGARHVADDDTALSFLGERIPVPELGLVLSFGDLLVAVGLADAVYVATRRRRPGGLPVAEVFAADERARAAAAAAAARRDPVAAAEPARRDEGVTIDLTGSTARRRRERPVEVALGQPVPIPMGWGPADDDDLRLVGAGARRAGGDDVPTTHVPWPWRRNPPPRPHHPTMRVTRH